MVVFSLGGDCGKAKLRDNIPTAKLGGSDPVSIISGSRFGALIEEEVNVEEVEEIVVGSIEAGAGGNEKLEGIQVEEGTY